MKQIFLLIFAVSSFYCLSQDNITSSFVYQDSTREYKIYIPQAYLDDSSSEVPLLLNLHGYGSVHWQQEFYGDFKPIADVENFIICHPNGTIDATGSRFWNVGFAPSNIDDVGFLSALIDSLSAEYNINAEKIFSTGMSNGGFMSHKLACELPDKIKAIASVTGSMTPSQFANCPNMNSIPVMQIHGTADPTVPYNGNASMIPVEEVVGFWVNHNGCDSVAVQTNLLDNDPGDNSTAIRYDFNTNCNDDASVVFYKIENGGHTWPGASFLIPGDVTNLDFNASEVIWEFFCPESNYTNIKSLSNTDKIKVYPNPSNDYIEIELTDEEKLIEVLLYNETGRLVLEQKERHCNISKLNKGIYFLKIKSNLDNYNMKIIKL